MICMSVFFHVEFSQGMILPSKGSPILQRSSPNSQDNETLKAANNFSASSGDTIKNDSKSIHSLYLGVMKELLYLCGE